MGKGQPFHPKYWHFSCRHSRFVNTAENQLFWLNLHHINYSTIFQLSSRLQISFNHHCLKKILQMNLSNWTLTFNRKGVLWFHHRWHVSMSVDKHVFSKTTHRIFLELFMKLKYLKGKNAVCQSNCRIFKF